MKRIGYLYDRICNVNNLILAEKKARRGKSDQKGVILFDKNPQDNIINLHHILDRCEFKTSKYTIFKINEGKERVIYKLPYYPDRIVHHAILNVLELIFVKSFTKNTYSCIKRRGIHKCAADLKSALSNVEDTTYCLKVDIKKFYPNIDHGILKNLLRRKFKDSRLLSLIDNIIDSAEGVPIGNYLSQFLANFYLSGFDHWLKEQKGVTHYFRYCDDIVILGNNKDELRLLMMDIIEYLGTKLKLTLKSNYQIFPVSSRGIDFVGYRFYHTHILLRNKIKKNFIRMIRRRKNRKSINSYNGWLDHCNSINLKNKYLNEEIKGGYS